MDLTIAFVNSVIPFLDELDLEFFAGDWMMVNGKNTLVLQCHDNIAQEDVEINFSEDTITQWGNAQTPRAEQYLIEVAVSQAVLSATTKPDPRYTPVETILCHDYNDLIQEWTDLDYGYDYEDSCIYPGALEVMCFTP